jgi:hypothetical protein
VVTSRNAGINPTTIGATPAILCPIPHCLVIEYEISTTVGRTAKISIVRTHAFCGHPQSAPYRINMEQNKCQTAIAKYDRKNATRIIVNFPHNSSILLPAGFAGDLRPVSYQRQRRPGWTLLWDDRSRGERAPGERPCQGSFLLSSGKDGP